MCLCGNSIDIGFREVYARLIETRIIWKASDPSDLSDCKNLVITLDPMDHDPND